MQFYIFCVIFLFILSHFALVTNRLEASSTSLEKRGSLTPPIAKRVPKEISLFNDVLKDNYGWLRNKENPEVINYLRAWNEYTHSCMESTKPLQEKLFHELKETVDEQVNSVPYCLGNYLYFEKNDPKNNFPIFCRKRLNSQSEEVLFDQNQLAKGKSYFKIFNIVPSPDGHYIVVAMDDVGTQYPKLLLKNCLTGEWLPDQIPNTNGEIVWSKDSKGIWYVSVNEVFRENRILYHCIGKPVNEDRIVLEEADPLYILEISLSASRDKIYLYDKSISTSQVYYLNTQFPEDTPRLISPKKKGLLYSVEMHGDNFYFIARDKDKDIVCIANNKQPSYPHWKEIKLKRPYDAIIQIIPFENFLVFETVKNGLKHFEVWDLGNDTVDWIQFPDPYYSVELLKYQNHHSSQLIFTYSCPVQPPITYAYQMKTKEWQVLRKSIYENFNKDLYKIERCYAKAKDGTLIPISLFYKRDALEQKAGAPPMLLTGYGAYGTILESGFSPHLLPLIDRGFIFAVTHVRGGGECGPRWYEEGRIKNKRNTFTDFIACAEYLIQKEYTSSDRLFIEGRSAGGLLVGVVSNWRPDLFKGVIAEVPFVDIINTLVDHSIPLTFQEKEEWGNPYLHAEYEYLKSYSPYENVKGQKYPNFLITAGLHDAQVPFWEPAKWVAKLVEYKKNDPMILFKINLNGGHLNANHLTERWKDLAFKYAFILKLAPQNFNYEIE